MGEAHDSYGRSRSSKLRMCAASVNPMQQSVGYAAIRESDAAIRESDAAIRESDAAIRESDAAIRGMQRFQSNYSPR
jgi:hypothetical protein